MEFIKAGKTKDVYKLPNGNICLKFKDTVTGTAGSQDPGGNEVVGEVKGVGSNALKVTSYYFELLKEKGVATHYVSSDVSNNEMVVKPAVMFGKGLECVMRYVATGSFIRRFGDFIKEGKKLNGLFEMTLKDDSKNDPPVTKEVLAALKILTYKQYNEIVRETKKICRIVKDDLAQKGLKLYDIKIEFGLVDGKIVLIDEISGGNMRVYKGKKKLEYMQIADFVFDKN